MTAEDPAAAHARLIKTAATNPSFYNNLITQYSRHPSTLLDAVRLFDRLPFRPTVASWTATISAASSYGPGSALHVFLLMLRQPSLPNQRTVATLLKSFSSSPALLIPLTCQLHSLSVKLFLAHLSFSGSALLSSYAKAGQPDDALKLFDGITDKDEVCYSSAIIGTVQNQHPVMALKLFVGMMCDGFRSNMYTVSGAFRAASELAALEQTRIVHGHSVVTGLESGVVVGTALTGAYGKAGAIVDAQQVFDGLSVVANVITWNVILSAYAQQGDGDSAVRLFEEMIKEGVECDKLTFLAVLTACGNAGMVSEAEQWLNSMSVRYGMKPGLEHYTCLISAMARVGLLEEAQRVALKMPFEPDDAVWRTLLSACVAQGKAEMARVVGQRLLDVDPEDESAYIMLASVYTASERRDEAERVHRVMKSKKLKRELGKSWIEVGGEVHVFIAGDKRHKRKAEIYAKVLELMEKIGRLGYEGSADEQLWYHSERLAVAFGLLSGAAPKGKALRVVKNLRICGDCHNAFKYMSLVIEREIVVRDMNRYHRFIHGICSCKDIW